MDSEFSATAEVGCAESVPDRPPVSVSNIHVGVAYEPLRRLWPLLGDQFRLAVLDERLREDVDGGQLDPLKVATPADAAKVAAEISGLVMEHADAFATRHASLEALLAELADGEEYDYVDDRLPALLAAAGRFDEARAALARYRLDRGDAEMTREARRFARQLGRWIDSGRDPGLVPSKAEAGNAAG